MEPGLRSIEFWIKHFEGRVKNYKPSDLGMSLEYYESELNYWKIRKQNFNK